MPNIRMMSSRFGLARPLQQVTQQPANYLQQEIKNYAIYYMCGVPPRVATIECFDASGRIGIVNFMEDGAVLEKNNVDVNGIQLYYHASQFNDIANMMRAESPLYLELYQDTGQGSVTSGFEPVGGQ